MKVFLVKAAVFFILWLITTIVISLGVIWNLRGTESSVLVGAKLIIGAGIAVFITFLAYAHAENKF